MRAALPLVPLLLVLPLALAAAISDPVGDQGTHVFTTQTFLGAPGPCADPATDLVGVALATGASTLEVRVAVADLAAPGPSCAGQDVGALPHRRWFSLFGQTDARSIVVLTSDGATGSGSACADLTPLGQCARAPATFHVDGNALVWTLPLDGPGPAGCNCTWDLRGERITLHAAARTEMGPLLLLGTVGVSVEDRAAALVADL